MSVDTQAVIFVVDAADELRFGVARNELDLLLEHDGKLDTVHASA